jgi:hypothetical protein
MRSSTTTPPNQAQQSQVVHDGGQLLIPAGDAAALSCACHDGMAAAWLKTGSLLSRPLPMVTAPLSCPPSSWRMQWSFPHPTPLLLLSGCYTAPLPRRIFLDLNLARPSGYCMRTHTVAAKIDCAPPPTPLSCPHCNLLCVVL